MPHSESRNLLMPPMPQPENEHKLLPPKPKPSERDMKCKKVFRVFRLVNMNSDRVIWMAFYDLQCWKLHLQHTSVRLLRKMQRKITFFLWSELFSNIFELSSFVKQMMTLLLSILSIHNCISQAHTTFLNNEIFTSSKLFWKFPKMLRSFGTFSRAVNSAHQNSIAQKQLEFFILTFWNSPSHLKNCFEKGPSFLCSKKSPLKINLLSS